MSGEPGITARSLHLVLAEYLVDSRLGLKQIPFAITAGPRGAETGRSERSAALDEMPALLLGHCGSRELYPFPRLGRAPGLCGTYGHDGLASLN